MIVGVVALVAARRDLRCYRPLLFTTFDPEVAEASGVNTARVDALLMLVLAASILATMKVLGVTLVAAALVIPPSSPGCSPTRSPDARALRPRSARSAASSG